MKHNIIAATILAVGLIIAAFVFSGRYYVITADRGVAIRVDRWTGNTERVEIEQTLEEWLDSSN